MLFRFIKFIPSLKFFLTKFISSHLGCLVAGIMVCLLVCFIGIAKRRKKISDPIPVSPGATHNGTYALPKIYGDTVKKESLFNAKGFYNPDADSWHILPSSYVDYIHVDRETTVWPADQSTFYYTNEVNVYDNLIQAAGFKLLVSKVWIVSTRAEWNRYHNLLFSNFFLLLFATESHICSLKIDFCIFEFLQNFLV